MLQTTTEPRQDTIRNATEADVEALAGVMARAFFDDPVVGDWCFPDASRRMRRLERGFALFLRRVHLPHREAHTTSGLEGGALWLPPGAWKASAFEQLRLLPAMARIYGSALPRILRVIAFLEERHPHEPHRYLQFLGVEPVRQGRGVGSSLLAPMLARCDRDGMPAYLEASSERNRGLYERHGFAVVEEVRLPGGGPPLWRMWREPAR